MLNKQTCTGAIATTTAWTAFLQLHDWRASFIQRYGYQVVLSLNVVDLMRFLDCLSNLIGSQIYELRFKLVWCYDTFCWYMPVIFRWFIALHFSRILSSKLIYQPMAILPSLGIWMAIHFWYIPGTSKMLANVLRNSAVPRTYLLPSRRSTFKTWGFVSSIQGFCYCLWFVT
jgi:hypothetical protein